MMKISTMLRFGSNGKPMWKNAKACFCGLEKKINLKFRFLVPKTWQKILQKLQENCFLALHFIKTVRWKMFYYRPSSILSIHSNIAYKTNNFFKFQIFPSKSLQKSPFFAIFLSYLLLKFNLSLETTPWVLYVKQTLSSLSDHPSQQKLNQPHKKALETINKWFIGVKHD